MKQLPLKIQQRFSVFGTCFDVSNIIISQYYIAYHSSYNGRKISSTINKYCKDLSVKIIFSPFKLRTMFSPKDFVPDLS